MILFITIVVNYFIIKKNNKRKNTESQHLIKESSHAETAFFLSEVSDRF